MAYIQPRKTQDGKTHYRVQVRLRGHPTQSATFRCKTDAKLWAQQTEASIREGRYFNKVEARRDTFAEMVDRYLAEILPRRREKDRQVITRQLKWWSERLGAYTLADVTASKIAEQRHKLGQGESASGRPIAPATQNRYLQTLSHVFTVAIREWEWVETNPISKVGCLREPQGRVRFLSDSERERLLAACREVSDPRLHLLVLLAKLGRLAQGVPANPRRAGVSSLRSG